MKLCSLKHNGANIGDTEEKTSVSFGELVRLAGIDPNLSDGFSFVKHGNAKDRRYSLCQCCFGVLNSLIFSGIGDEHYFAVKDIREALADIERTFLQVDVAQTIGADGNQISFLRIEGQDAAAVGLHCLGGSPGDGITDSL
jgi:hypothetical protein